MCCKKKSYFLVKEKGQGQMLMSVEGQCHYQRSKMFQLKIVVIKVRETILPVLMLFVVLTCIFPDING